MPLSVEHSWVCCTTPFYIGVGQQDVARCCHIEIEDSTPSHFQSDCTCSQTCPPDRKCSRIDISNLLQRVNEQLWAISTHTWRLHTDVGQDEILFGNWNAFNTLTNNEKALWGALLFGVHCGGNLVAPQNFFLVIKAATPAVSRINKPVYICILWKVAFTEKVIHMPSQNKRRGLLASLLPKLKLWSDEINAETVYVPWEPKPFLPFYPASFHEINNLNVGRAEKKRLLVANIAWRM